MTIMEWLIFRVKLRNYAINHVANDNTDLMFAIDWYCEALYNIFEIKR